MSDWADQCFIELFKNRFHWHNFSETRCSVYMKHFKVLNFCTVSCQMLLSYFRLPAWNDIAVIVCMKWHRLKIIRSNWKSNSVSLRIFIYTRNIPTKLYPDPVWNRRALGFFGSGYPSKKKQNKKMSSNRRSVADVKLARLWRDGVWNCCVGRWSGWCTGLCLHCSQASNS